jgi:serine phosphatase RsbU (regulator of sigma subunit)
MDLGQHLLERRRSPRFDGLLMVVATAFILVLTGIDLPVPSHVRLSEMLVAAPVVLAWFAGPRATGVTGTLAVAGLLLIMFLKGTLNHLTELAALVLISVFSTAICYVRERRIRQLAQVRTVSEAAQQAVLRPLPQRAGPLRLASVYLAAEDEAQIGGDLYAVARTGEVTRLIIGDVRGKGLNSIGEAATLIGAFHGAAHGQASLSELAAYLEGSVCSNVAEPAEPEMVGESFITAAILEIPDNDPVVRLVNCGHPPPLLLRKNEVVALDGGRPAPPLGLSGLTEATHHVETFCFEAGDILLLYTDGLMEARDASGTFFPLGEWLAGWAEQRPAALVQGARKALLGYVGGRLGDDAAILAVERTSIG